MSTNYYIYTDNPLISEKSRHIGKRVSIGEGKTKFIWGYIDRTKFLKCNTVHEKYIRETHPFVVDEYGREFTTDEILDLIFACDEHCRGSEGTIFC